MKLAVQIRRAHLYFWNLDLLIINVGEMASLLTVFKNVKSSNFIYRQQMLQM